MGRLQNQDKPEDLPKDMESSCFRDKNNEEFNRNPQKYFPLKLTGIRNPIGL